MKDLIKNIRFSHILAFWTITFLLGMYLYAILLPEKFANSPIVTQFTTMAGSVIMLILSFYFGGMAEKNRQKPAEPGTLIVPEQEIETKESKTDKSNE